MLLRAGLLYCLAVTSMIFGFVAAWQRLEIGAGRDNLTQLSQRVEQLQQDLREERIKFQSAERRAVAAEDSLARVADREAQAADDTRFKLAGELAAALQERDAARNEASKLVGALENAQNALRDAEADRDAAQAAERVARAENESVKAASAAALAAQATTAAGGSRDVETRKAAAADPGEAPAAPAAKSSQIETSAITPKPVPPKAAAVPAVPVKPAAAAVQSKPAPKKAAAKPQPKRAATRPAKPAQFDSFPF